ncbi:MAG: YkgJ family cysteine cluster protein [Planctomycetaceae bacterium]|nr:YkgJ family cysteine cluster protein [Planctomycetaceae bacterium]
MTATSSSPSDSAGPVAGNAQLPPEFADLPIVASCTDCGACCSRQGAPPDYVALERNLHFRNDPSFADDAERLDQLPDVARELLQLYLDESAAGTRPTDSACVWLDSESLQCRFYEWRPSTCRVFELNSPGCLIYRRLCGIN